MLFWSLLCFLKASAVFGEGFEEFFKWKQIEYDISLSQTPLTTDFTFPDNIPSNNVVNGLDYIPYNNVPMGVTRYKGMLFITVPRRRPGIPSTLNYVYVSAHKSTTSPKLKPYPNFTYNKLHPQLRPDPQKIISVYRTRVDACERLWFVDTGMLEDPSNRTQVQRPSIWIMNLRTEEPIRRFEIPENVVPIGRGLISITIDVDSNNCDDAYAYMPDLVHNALYVYSYRENRIWTFRHNYFNFDPLFGDFNIAGQSYQWSDGIFSITLGNKQQNGFRTAYFHPFSSISEFTVSTKVLRNESNAIRSYHGMDFQHLSIRGIAKQSNIHAFDPESGIILYNEPSQYGVGCWNTNQEFSTSTHGVVYQNPRKMIYPSDLNIDAEGTVWVLSNSIPIFIYSKLDTNQYNYRIWKQTVRKAVEGTICAP